MSKSIAGPDRIFYINDHKNSHKLEYGNVEYPAYVEVYSRPQSLNLPGLSRSGLKFTVYLTPGVITSHFPNPAIHTFLKWRPVNTQARAMDL